MRIVVHSQDLFEDTLRVSNFPLPLCLICSMNFFCILTALRYIKTKLFNELTLDKNVTTVSNFIGGGFNISPLKPRNGRPRTQVQHLMQIDLKGWGVNYISSFQQHCLLQMLSSVSGTFLLFASTHLKDAFWASCESVTFSIFFLRSILVVLYSLCLSAGGFFSCPSAQLLKL